MSGTANLQMDIVKTLSLSDQPMKLEELARLIDFSKNATTQAICKLIVRGFVDRIEAGTYKITDQGKAFVESGKKLTSGPLRNATGNRAPNIRGSLTQRAWNVMRMGGAFDVPGLVSAASNGDKKPDNTLQRYLRYLVKADYVILLPTRTRGTRPGSNGFKRYRLIKDTGEIAPTLRLRAKPVELFDQNTQEVVPCV